MNTIFIVLIISYHHLRKHIKIKLKIFGPETANNLNPFNVIRFDDTNFYGSDSYP